MATVPKDPVLWRKIHNLWISEIYQRLKPQVKGRLALGIDEDVTVSTYDAPPSRVQPDLYASERTPAAPQPSRSSLGSLHAVAYAEGTEEWDTEIRHFIVVRDLRGESVVGILEILSPTNKGYFSESDRIAFMERRQRLLASAIAYMEIDAVPVGTRWLPRCLAELATHAGVGWSSLPIPPRRSFRGWAWNDPGPLPRIPWDLGDFGVLSIDLDESLREALDSAGIAPE